MHLLLALGLDCLKVVEIVRTLQDRHILLARFALQGYLAQKDPPLP